MTIGAELERCRLERRALRLELLIALLRERSHSRSRSGPGMSLLERRISELSRELARIRSKLDVVYM
jgi:hypothetical protein